MKYVKILGPLTAAIAAAMALAGSASATVLCNNNASTTACSSKVAAGTAIKSKLTGSAILETTGGTVIDTCTGGEFNGSVGNAGSSTTTVSGNTSAITSTGCTLERKTVALGSFEIHSISSADNGTFTASGLQVTYNAGFIGPCTYGTGENKDLGTLVGGSPATIAVSTSLLLISNESGLCPTEGKWTATYEITAPKPLFVTSA
jgi:hypothetical protein